MNSQTVLLADDTSIIVSNQEDNVLEANLNSVFSSMMKWFNANLLLLNMDTAYIMEFYPKDTINFEKKIIYNNKIIPNTMEQKFHGLILHSTVSWKSHTDTIISE